MTNRSKTYTVASSMSSVTSLRFRNASVTTVFCLYWQNLILCHILWNSGRLAVVHIYQELFSAGNQHTDQKWLHAMIIQMWEPIAQLLKQYSNIDIVQKNFPLFPPFIKWHSTIVWHLFTEICVCLPKRNIQRSEYVSHVTHEWKPLQPQQSHPHPK